MGSKYDKLAEYLEKEFFTVAELRNLVNNELVSNVSKEDYNIEHENCSKYSVHLTDGSVYFIYVQ